MFNTVKQGFNFDTKGSNFDKHTHRATFYRFFSDLLLINKRFAGDAFFENLYDKFIFSNRNLLILALEKKEEATDFELGLEAGGKINKKKRLLFK